MHARSLLAAAALAALALRPALARDLNVLANDQMRDAMQQTFVAPFASATGLPAQTEGWGGGLDALRARLQAPNPTTDVVQLSSDDLQPACDAGLLEKLDFSQIGGKDHYLPLAVTDCGVGAVITALVLAWDKDKFPATPTWADFWDVAKYPGKRGLHDGVRGSLEIALMADGVAPGDVYKTLATSDGVDRAFRKLDQLRPYIVWWKNGADAAHLLVSNDALMTSAPSEAVVAAQHAAHRNFAIQWAGNLSALQYLGHRQGQHQSARGHSVPVFRRHPRHPGAAPVAAGGGQHSQGGDGFPQTRGTRIVSGQSGEPRRRGASGHGILARQPRQIAAALRRLEGALTARASPRRQGGAA